MVLTITMTLVMTMASTPCIYAFLLRSSPSPSVDGLSSSNKEKVLPHQGLHAVRYSDKEGDQQETLPDFSTPQRCDRRRNASNSNCHSSSVVKTLVRGVAGILLMAQIMTASVFPTHATAPALEAASQPPLSQQQQSTVYGQPYWTIMNEGQDDGRIAANTALMDYAVGTINSMFYDHSGGAFFQPRDFYATWKAWIKQPDNQESLASRDGVVNGLQWLTAQLNDPFSRYLTREQLREELSRSNFGFLGSGAIVEVPAGPTFFGSLRTPVMSEVPPTLISKRGGIIVGGDRKQLLSAKFVQKLPVLTAISPDSPAERAGLTVGDRIVAVQQDSFLGLSSSQAVKDKLTGRYQADNYAGTTELTVAKPVYAIAPIIDAEDVREVIVGYRSQRLRLTTASVSPPIPSLLAETTSSTSTAVSVMKLAVAGGDSLVHYQLLAAEPGQPSSLFLGAIGNDKGETQHRETVAYIRLTRFSKATTDAFVKTIERLENDNSDHGRSSPNSYIIDLRNNYGGGTWKSHE
jgi:PDZ domain/Peptidase family S41